MRIGIISDTHGRLPEEVHQAFAGVAHIIHAGDIGSPEILWELEAIAPTTAVLGNNDWRDFGPSVRHEAALTLEGVRIHVSHFPETAARSALTGQFDLCIHGHTHVPADYIRGAARVVNPGSTTRPRQQTAHFVAIATLRAGQIYQIAHIALNV